MTLHQPFVGYETVKELILEGGRPPLTFRELSYPTYILDLMVVCWSHRPRDRPSASQIVSIASAPEFLHLADCVSIDQVCVILWLRSYQQGRQTRISPPKVNVADPNPVV